MTGLVRYFSRSAGGQAIAFGVDAVLLVVLCVGAGLWLQRIPDAERAAAGLNRYVLDVAVPALVLTAIPSLEAQRALFLAAALPWAAFVVAGGAWWALGRLFGLAAPTVASLVLVTGLGNTAFVGFPVIEALYGSSGLEVAVVVDQAGSFLVFATLGVWVAQMGSGERGGLSVVLGRVMRFPPFIALLLALSLPRFAAGAEVLALVDAPLRTLAATVSPVALVTVGMRTRLRWDAFTDRWVWTALSLRMLAFPVAAWAIASAFRVPTEVLEVTVLQVGMPPMVTGALLAAERGLDPDRAMRAVALGLPATLVTVPLLRLLMSSFRV